MELGALLGLPKRGRPGYSEGGTDQLPSHREETAALRCHELLHWSTVLYQTQPTHQSFSFTLQTSPSVTLELVFYYSPAKYYSPSI